MEALTSVVGGGGGGWGGIAFRFATAREHLYRSTSSLILSVGAEYLPSADPVCCAAHVLCCAAARACKDDAEKLCKSASDTDSPGSVAQCLW